MEQVLGTQQRAHAKEDADDDTAAESDPIPGSIFTSLASALAHERLQQLTQGAAQSTPLYIRRRCGRWLTLQRMRRHVSAADVADRVGVDAASLEWLELGLAADTPVRVTQEQLNDLALLLADRLHDADFTLTVLRLATDPHAEAVAHVVERLTLEITGGNEFPDDN